MDIGPPLTLQVQCCHSCVIHSFSLLVDNGEWLVSLLIILGKQLQCGWEWSVASYRRARLNSRANANSCLTQYRKFYQRKIRWGYEDGWKHSVKHFITLSHYQIQISGTSHVTITFSSMFGKVWINGKVCGNEENAEQTRRVPTERFVGRAINKGTTIFFTT